MKSQRALERKQKQKIEWAALKPVNRAKKDWVKQKRILNNCISVGAFILAFGLFCLLCTIATIHFEKESTWSEDTFYFSHDKMVASGYRFLSRRHVIYGTNGETYYDPYEITLDSLQPDDLVTVKYYNWFFKKSIATIKSDTTVFIDSAHAEARLKSLVKDNFVLIYIIAAIFLLLWLPIFIYFLRKYINAKNVYANELQKYKDKEYHSFIDI